MPLGVFGVGAELVYACNSSTASRPLPQSCTLCLSRKCASSTGLGTSSWTGIGSKVRALSRIRVTPPPLCLLGTDGSDVQVMVATSFAITPADGPAPLSRARCRHPGPLGATAAFLGAKAEERA